MGRAQNLKALHRVTVVWRPTSAQGTGSSHQLVTVVENVVLRANWPCSKSDSTEWCQEAAACTEVRPCEHRRTARANTEKADAARSCGEYGPWCAKSHDLTKSWCNAHARNVTGLPSVSNGSGAPTCSQTDTSAWQMSW